MIAVVVSLVAVVLLVLVVVALGMRSMNRRESALPPERLREMAEKEALTQTMSSDDFATREPKMNHFTPDLTPFDEPKPPRQPRPPSSRGKRGMNEFGQMDDYDDDYWTRLQADEGGFGGALATRMGASRPVEQEGQKADADAVTVQAPLPTRPQPSRATPQRSPASPARPAPEPAIASSSLPSGLSDLVAPVQPNPAPTAASLAEQKTVTFAAPTPGESRPSRSGSRRGGHRPSSQAAAQPAQSGSPRSAPGGGGPSRSTPGAGPARPDPLTDPLGGSYPRRGAGATANAASRPGGAGSPASPASPANGPGARSGPAGGRPAGGSAPMPPPMPPMGPTTSGGFPAATDPLAVSYRNPPQPPKPGDNVADNPWAQATNPSSGGWPAANTADILDDPAPSYSSYQTPVYGAPPAGSYEVSSGWATFEDDAITGPSPAVSTSTGPSKTFSPTPERPADPRGGAAGGYGYEPRPATPASPAAWPEPGTPPGSDGTSWPSYGELYGTAPAAPETAATGTDARGRTGSSRGNHRAQEPDYPDYYR